MGIDCTLGTLAGVPSDEPKSDIDLLDYVGILRRQWWIIAVCTLAVGVAAIATAFAQTKQYRTSATLFVGRSAASEFVDPLKGVSDPFRRLANEVQIVQGQGVADAVEKRLGFRASISASGSTTEDLITLTAVDTDPQRASQVANAFADVYIEYRKTAGVGDNQSVETQLAEQIAKRQTRLDGLSPASPERASLVAQLSTLREQLATLQLGAALDPPAEVLNHAAIPGAPFEPRPRRALLLGLAVGLILGVGLALLRDFLDDTLKSQDDLRRVSHSLPLLAEIPESSKLRNASSEALVDVDPLSPMSERFRSLRTSIQYLSLGDSDAKVILFTSAMPAEGKSVTVANLALAFARSGKKVVMVDADLRRPRLATLFGLKHDLGLISVLNGRISTTEALQKVPNEAALYLLGAGAVLRNPSEVLSTRSFAELLAGLARTSDIVLVDSPPLLPVTDAAVLAELSSAVVLIARSKSTSRKHLRRAHELLTRINAPVAGVVFIGQESSRDPYGGYGYSYG